MANELIKWPEWMPLPQQGDYNYESVERRTRTEMEVGSVVRVNFDTDETTVNCSLILNQTQSAWFEAFEKHLMAQGSRWFVMPLETGGLIRPHKVRFKQRPKTAKKAPLYNNYSFVLELDKRPDVLCPALFRYLMCASPQSLGNSARALRVSMQDIVPAAQLPNFWTKRKVLNG